MAKAAKQRPRLVVEFWHPGASYHDNGPLTKAKRVLWEELGYTTRCRVIRASDVGSSVDHAKVVVVRVHQRYGNFDWPHTQLESAIRPMANCLKPVGVPGRAFIVGQSTGHEPKANRELMPGVQGRVIRVDGKRRRLLGEELTKGLGAPTEWFKESTAGREMLKQTVSIHILEYLSPLLLQPSIPLDTAAKDNAALQYDAKGRHRKTEAINPPFQWFPPDLSEGSPFFKERVTNLERAARLYPNPDDIIEDGLELLVRHRGNYTATHPDPKCLQLIWWEFPRDHWEALRLGSSMNFLRVPVEGLWPNSEMDDAQKDVAAEFVDELIELKVLDKIDETLAKSTCPLFCVPKAGQPGQYRCIADMKAGRQNEAIGADPTIFPKSYTIIQQLYTGGFSAVVDCSKFFHQFSTLITERKWLCMRHPKTGILYWYTGLPMGSGSSPGLAGRYGNAFIRKLTTECPAFMETDGAIVNTWGEQFASEQDMNETIGFGRFGIGQDGLPVALAWAHCDDFFIHGPTYEKTCKALTQFLDKTVEVGLLCHPKKLTPPAHVVKYTGFIFDTTAEPTLKIPIDKRERCLAIVDDLVNRDKPISRQALAVAIGVLESVTEATPSRMGRTHLRSMYATMHSETEGYIYHTCARLSERNKQDLHWWRTALHKGTGRRGRSARPGTLIPSFGDGSGTGSGGTIQHADGSFEMWMGAWSPEVWHFSSNWKELRTLLATLERAAAKGKSGFTGATFFYFTDNLVTYFITFSGTSTSPELHAMIQVIKELEIELDITLEVVHIPGTWMIIQGTDGLSRGIWMSNLQERPGQREILKGIFAPVPMSFELAHWAAYHAGLPSAADITLCDWNTRLDFLTIVNHCTLWCPPPETAAQLIYQLLTLYMEAPLTTSMLIVVPRILQRRWGRASRVVQEIGCYSQESVPFANHGRPLPIPIVLLYVPPHIRVCPDPHSVDKPSSSYLARWHKQEAENMRGLQGAGLISRHDHDL